MVKHRLNNNKPKTKGFRDGVTKEDVLNLTKDERRFIEKQRELQTVKADSISYKVYLSMDDGRRQLQLLNKDIRTRLLNIDNVLTVISRKQKQLNSGDITDELRPGVPFTKAEMELEVNRASNMAWAESKDIMIELAKIRRWVGCHDIAGNLLMSESDYDNLVRDVEGKLRDRGYDLFDDNIKNYPSKP